MGAEVSKAENQEQASVWDDKKVLTLNEVKPEIEELYKQKKTNQLELAKQMLDLAAELDEQQRQLDIAQTFFASMGVAGSMVSVVGLGLSFVTCGAPLVVGVVGGGIMAVGGAGTLASSIAENVVAMAKLKKVYQLLEEELEGEILIVNMITAAKETGVMLAHEIIEITKSKMAEDMGSLVGTIYKSTKTTVYKSVKTTVHLAKTVTTSYKKVVVYGGCALSLGVMAFNIYTIIDRSIKIYNKTPAKAAEIIRKLALKLREDLQPKPSYCERRSLDFQLRDNASYLF